jgi:hypothetical protein
MKKYAIFDHRDSEYSFHESLTKEEMIQTLVDKMIEMHLKMTNNQLWSIVETEYDSDGNVGHHYLNVTDDELPNLDLLKSKLFELIFDLTNTNS